MNSVVEKSELTNKSESTSPILVSSMTKKKRKKYLNNYKSPENGGFYKKKLKSFEENSIHFLSAPGCSRYNTNDKCVRRNLNKLFCDLKEQKYFKKTKSSPKHLPQHENTYCQLHENRVTLNTECNNTDAYVINVFNSYKNCQNKEEGCKKMQNLRNCENEICKSGLPVKPTLHVYNKNKDDTLIDDTKTGLFEASQRYREHSPLMEFESPVRCSMKSNSDVNGSPLLFHEFDLDAGSSAEVCTLMPNECIWNDNTITIPMGKIEEYNTQKLTEQKTFQRNVSTVFIDSETSKPDSFKISPLKSEDLMNEDFISSRRTTNVPDLFCADKININKEAFTNCLETINHSHKLHEPVIIEECSSPRVIKQGLSKPSLLHSNFTNDINKDLSFDTTESYERIEDCSQESYVGGSHTLSQYRNKNAYNEAYDIIEFEQTQSECENSLHDGANISLHLSPGLNNISQAYSPAKEDAGNPQSVKLSEQLGQGTTLLDSPANRRKRKAKSGSLISRLNQIVRRYRSETNIWKHENKYMGIIKKSKVNLNVLRIISVRKENTRIVLHCCRDVIVDSRKTETSKEEGYINFKIIIVLETPDAQNLVEGSCVRIFPPWQILELENKRTLVFLCVSKLELLSNSKPLSTKKNTNRVVEKDVIDFSSNISQSCLSQNKCSCFSKVKALYFPLIFRENIVSKSAAVKRYYSSEVHTIRSSVINSVIFSEIHARGQVVYEFRCRNASDRGTTANILVVDNENEVFQIVLKTENDEHKWQLEKSKHSNIQNICFQFSGLVVCTQLEVHRTPGLASLLTHLKLTSHRQDYLYVLSASCDLWNLKPCGKSDCTFLPDKIDNNGLLQLCSQIEEVRRTAVVTVLLFTGKKLYFQGNRLKPYGIICVDDFAVVPKIKCGYFIEVCCLKYVCGKFTVDRYSVITVQEDWTKHISFYVASLPCLTMQTKAEELVTVKDSETCLGIIKEISEEYCSCNKKWEDGRQERCQALCKTNVENAKTVIAFVKVSELPSECIVKVKELNKTLCRGSSVSLVCLVISVLRNEQGKVYGFIVKNL